jgi:hypothetical protein
MDNDKIININKILQERNPSVSQIGLSVLQSLKPEEADAATQFIFNMILINVEIGLGIIETDDDPELEAAIDEFTDEDMIFFEKINDAYKRSVRNCYFCRNDVDPNDEFVTKETYICLICSRKLKNFIASLGIPKEGILIKQRVRKTDPNLPPKK